MPFDVKAIVLAGGSDFGRCPVASRVPTTLWPVLGQSAVERVLKHLGACGVREVSVCYEGDVGPFEALARNVGDVKLKFFKEHVRAGTAGCMRCADDGGAEGVIVVFPANILCTPDVEGLVRAHIERKADLTAVFNPGREKRLWGDSAGIYVCSRSVLGYIPKIGYADIKEWLIPELLQKGKVVKALELEQDVGNFRDGREYLLAMADYLAKGPPLDEEVSSLRCKAGQNLWLGEGAEIDSSARFFRPVVVMERAQVAKDAVVFGPSVVGRNCRVGRGSVVLNSVLWDGAGIGANCEVRNCLLDYNVNVVDKTVVQNRVVAFVKTSVLASKAEQVSQRFRNNVSHLWEAIRLGAVPPRSRFPAAAGLAGTSKAVWLAGIVIAAAFLWSYWPGIVDLWSIWLRSDEYSSGILVPFLAGYILWLRRDSLRPVPVRPALWGFIIFLLAEGMRLFGLFFMYGSAERLAVVVGIVAIVLILVGWEFFKKTATVMLFLCMMLPWPNRVQAAVTLPLQRWAIYSAVFCLEVMGYDVSHEGNIIHIGQSTVAVAEACNGLRMVTAFFVISALVVLLVKRRWWHKLVILVSSLPVALLCNTIRLAITAIAFTWLEGDYWEKIFHDFGGYAMMPLALAIVVFELWLLERLTLRPSKENTIIITAK